MRASFGMKEDVGHHPDDPRFGFIKSDPTRRSLPSEPDEFLKKDKRVFLERLPVVDIKNPAQANEQLGSARERLLENQTIFQRFLEAVIDKNDNASVLKFAALENDILRICLNLQVRDVPTVIQQMYRNFIAWFDRSGLAIKKSLSPDLVRRIHTIGDSKSPIHPESIISTIEYIRIRRGSIERENGDHISFYVNSELDARHAIDLVEFVYRDHDSDTPAIREMRLVQIKNSFPTSFIIDDIHAKHTQFVDQDILDSAPVFDAYRRSREVATNEAERWNVFFLNESKFLDFLIDFSDFLRVAKEQPHGTEVFDQAISDYLFKKLELDVQLTTFQKLELLKYERHLMQAAAEVFLSSDEIVLLMSAYDDLIRKLTSAVRLPMSVENISSVVAGHKDGRWVYSTKVLSHRQKVVTR